MPRANPPRSWLVAAATVAWFGLCIGLYLARYPHSPTLLPMIPLGILVILLAVWHFEGLLFLMVVMVPLSVGFTDLGGGMGAAIPGEPLLLLAALGIVLLMIRGQVRPLPLLQHPLGILILLHLLWAAISMLGSTHDDISLKFLAARATYVLVYYIGFGTLFLHPGRIITFAKAYLWGLVPVMLWSVGHLGYYGLSRKFSPVMAEPFYDDHTVFGACLAMVLPLVAWMALREELRIPVSRGRNFGWPLLALVAVTLLLTFSRATWMGLVVMAAMLLLLRLRIRFRFLVMALLLVGVAVWAGKDMLLQRMEQNENISGEDVLSTAASVTNVNTDDSNKERINRWACAVRMFEDRPWLGFGPGTYEREYGNYQVLGQMTRISTWRGDRGDAHSEYLGVLAEQGIPGLLLLAGLFLLSVRVGMRVAYQGDGLRRGLATAIVLGLCSYYFHGFVNDFLDIDKAAALFWGMLGMLTALDLQRASTPVRNPAA